MSGIEENLLRILKDLDDLRTDYSNHRYRLVAFLLPIIEDEIWLGQRNTEPKKGFYGGIGGKNEISLKNGLYHVSNIVHLPIFGDHRSHEDYITQVSGREMLSETAAREFCEEAFSELVYPSDFNKSDITHLLRLGFVGDILTSEPTVTNLCYFYLGRVNRKDFSLSSRELSAIRPLSTISPEEIFPLTRVALEQVRHLNQLYADGSGYLPFNENHFTPSIFEFPEQDFKEFKDTDMSGVLLNYMKNKVMMPYLINGRAPITSIEEAMYMGLRPNQAIYDQDAILSERLVCKKKS